MSGKRVLVCPLDWGIGHASRCIPLIGYLRELGYTVIIGAEGPQLALLRKEFPEIEFLEVAGYRLNFPRHSKMWLATFFSIPKILRRASQEGRELDEIIRKHRIDAVISDNRFGLCSKLIPSVYITHQLLVKFPFAESALQKLHYSFIKQFDLCLLPDFEGEDNLSGILCHGLLLPANAVFVGPLSRFSSFDAQTSDAQTSSPTVMKYDVLAILSGREPQRTIFAEMIIDQLKSTAMRALVVMGLPQKDFRKRITPELEVVSHLDTTQMHKACRSAKLILSRSGYSTIMDLSYIGGKAIFVPTPGAPEQEYLAEYFMQKGVVFSSTQREFELQLAVKQAERFSGFTPLNNQTQNQKRIERIKNILREIIEMKK